MDLTLLRLLRTRERYEKLVKAVPQHVLEIQTQTVLADFGKFFSEFPDVKELEEEPFWLWFSSFAHPKLSDETRAKYKLMLREVHQPVAPELEAGLMERLVAADTASKLENLLTKWNDGAEVDLGSQMRSIVEQFEMDTERKVKTPWVQDDINDLLKDDMNDAGFHWRLDGLNLSMRPLRSGDFIIIAARPDVGKTTFLTDQLTHFGPQVEGLYPEQNRCILWFNNEGPGKRIITRLYQSALNATASELVEMSKAGTIRERYNKAVGGSHMIRVFDIHDFWNHEVEDIIRTTPPAMIVFDMVDNIRFGGSVGNNGQRTDQLLEAMYQWARVIAVKHDCPVLATSQISADGENLAWPGLGMLKDSKTGKQGAADAIITIGYNKDWPNTRYLNTTKNKLARERGPKQPKLETMLQGSRGRYTPIADPSGFEDAPRESPASEDALADG